MTIIESLTEIQIENFIQKSLNEKKYIYFICIQGGSMQVLAQILNSWGHRIAGHDINQQNYDFLIKNYNYKLFNTNCESNIDSSTGVLIVNGITSQLNFPEVDKAKELGIPIIKRIELLNYITNVFRDKYNKKKITILGSSGKTSTTDFLTTAFSRPNEVPMTFIGSPLAKKSMLPRDYILKKVENTNEKNEIEIFNQNEYKNTFQESNGNIIIELDESTPDFYNTNCDILVLTSLYPDHLDTYDNKFENLFNIFKNYINKIPMVVICLDYEPLRQIYEMKNDLSCDFITYSTENSNANVYVYDLKQDFNGVSGKVKVNYKNIEKENNFHIPVWGIHFGQNLGGVIGALLAENINNNLFDFIPKLSLPKNRMEVSGYYKDFYFIDDYGHNFFEIITNVKNIKENILNKLPAKKDNYKKKFFVVVQIYKNDRFQRDWRSYIEMLPYADYCYFVPVCAENNDNLYIHNVIENLAIENGFNNCLCMNSFNDVAIHLKNIIDREDEQTGIVVGFSPRVYCAKQLLKTINDSL